MAETTRAELAAQVRRLRKSLEREKAKSAALAKSRKEAFEQRAATAEILTVISRSPADAQPVFDAIVKSALRLMRGHSALVTRIVHGIVNLGAFTSTSKAGDAVIQKGYPRPIDRGSATGRAARTGRPSFVSDIQRIRGSERSKAVARERGYRSLLAVPMLCDSVVIGTLNVTRKEPGPFRKQEIKLLQTFAQQAVIAIENVRLFNETKEALERQTATSDLLKVIGRSTSDLQPVFDTIAEDAVRLCEARQAFVFRFDGRHLHVVAACNASAELRSFFERNPIAPGRGAVAGRTVLEGRTLHVHDIRADPEYQWGAHQVDPMRTVLTIPMIRAGEVLGVIGVNRHEVRPFSDKQIALLQTFADQAVIAIENVRLFNETKEALERQTASSEILRVVARSVADAQPVFQAILASLLRLFEGFDATVWTVREGLLVSVVRGGATLDASVATKIPLTGEHPYAAALRDHRVLQLDDVTNARNISQAARADLLGRNRKAVVLVPLLRDGSALGALSVSRATPYPFTAVQVDLLRNFADQATIAIENARLFNETREALERQTATAEILRVIGSSPTDTQPVFEAIVQSGLKLFPESTVGVARPDGDQVHMVAIANRDAAVAEATKARFPIRLTREYLHSTAILDARVVDLPDAELAKNGPFARGIANFLATANRAMTVMPMLRGDKAIGAISVTRPVPGPLTEKQLSLLRIFADQAVIAIENVRLFNETKESLERQTATAEILKVIASSPSDVQPVFDAIVASGARLFGRRAVLRLPEEGHLRQKAISDRAPGGAEAIPIDHDSLAGRVFLEGRSMQVPDTLAPDAPPFAQKHARTWNFRSNAAAPLLLDGKAIGIISVNSPEPGALADKQMELLQTFADQAVIAIQNVRLFNETKDALERQTATAEILQVIGSSPTDTQPVFDAIVNSGVRLFPGAMITVARPDGGSVRAAAIAHEDTTMVAGWRERFTTPLSRDRLHAAAILDAKLIDFPDAEAEKDGPLGPGVRNFLLSGNRAVTIMPMLRGEGAIGAISVTRAIPGPLSDKQIAILRTFADQAVIAIENVRLFNETKESLERQTATAEILKVIASSPSDVQPVFDAIAGSARRLLGGHAALVARRAGDVLELAAFTSTGEAGDSELGRLWPAKITGKGHMGKALVSATPAWVEDIETDPSYSEEFRAGARARGMRSAVSVPMLREGEAIGVISVNRSIPGRFSDHQTNLLKTFADQALIAIENVRLFNETKESLERQTATAEILKVIASSPSDVQPVFDAIVNSVSRLFGRKAALRTVESAGLRRRARSYEPAPGEFHGPDVEPLDRSAIVGQAVLGGRALQWADTLVEGAATYGIEKAKSLAFRSIASAPLMREGKAIGVISVSSPEPGSLSDKQMALLSTFADQAVIAIENVRLFNELQSRTEALGKSVEKLTALGEVGQAISSTLDLEKVLTTIASRAVQLTGLDGASIYEYDEAAAEFRLQVAHNFDPEFLQAIRNAPIRKGDGTVGGVAITLEPAQVTDILEGSYHSSRKELLARAGYRAVLTVPLLREDHIIGALSVTRKTPGPFADEIVELLKTFATQSAMAIQNARLFREIHEKGKQLEEASKHKSQFLASMSHELRTPLNAILGFNEMILGDIYGEVPVDMKEPLTDIQTSGKHLLRLINNVLDLAKIEAGRMELALDDYSVHDTVESIRSTLRPLAEAKGLELAVDVPSDIPLARGDGGRITQCLMNLAGNSLKFTKQGRVGISVALSNGTLTYQVKDTGIGIPADKIGGLFTEFKQTDATIASEYGGTGLGLSITKKFIEMHGGRIWAESEPGSGSTFIFEIPLRAEEAKDA